VASTGTVVVGVVTSVGPTSLTVQTATGPQAVTIASGAVVFLNGSPVPLAQIAAGDNATIALQSGQGAAVSADSAAGQPASSGAVGGTLASLSGTSLVLNMVEMPSITGLSPAQATLVIRRTDLTLQVSGTGATVLTQDPPPGAMVQQWTQVEAYTTPQALEPAGFVQVPAVQGQTIAQAAATLSGANLAMVADGVGTAVSQEPPAGSRAAPGTSVQVQFSKPNATSTG
jgi:hypothetical protein